MGLRGVVRGDHASSIHVPWHVLLRLVAVPDVRQGSDNVPEQRAILQERRHGALFPGGE